MATAAPDSILIQSLADSHSGIGQTIEGSGAAASNPGAGAQSVNGQYVSSGAISGGGLGSGAEVSVTPGEGNVGSLSIAANGSYTLSVSDAAAQQFAPGEPHTETFVLQSADGSTHQLSFTVQQTPEGVSIGAPAVAVPDPVTGMFTDTQTAIGSFPVNAEGQVPSVQSLLGAGEPSLGMLSISDSGQYTYSVSTSASQAINANDTRAQSFSVQTPDGGNQQISFTVHGAGQDGGIAQQPISVNVSGNDAGDGRVLPDDAALTALDASAVGFWRVPTDGPGVAAANTAIASARGAASTNIPVSSAGADAARSVAVAGLSDAGDSGPPISKAGVLEDDGAGLDRDAEVSEPGLASPPVAPLLVSNPIVEAAPAPVPAVVPDPPPEPAIVSEPAPEPAPPVAAAPEPAVPPGPPEPPGPPVVLPVPSVIGAVLGASVQEDVNVQPGNLLARTGLIEVTASTPALATFSTSVVSTGGNLGILSIDSLGSYSYNVSNAIVQYLGVADSKVDSFTIATADGTTKEVRFTIFGTNDAATIGDLSPSAVTEDLSVTLNQLRASGVLTVVDIDQNQSVFQTVVTGATSNLGTLVLAANGNYTYSVANAAVQYLGVADTKIETFTVKSFDGTEKIEQVTIFGVNDAAVIGDLPVATVTEDLAVVADQLFARGTISITDVDQNQASFQTVVDSAAGNLGALTLAADGQYTYSVSNPLVQYLGALDTKLETFTVTSFDGTTKTEQVTIRGVNDAALITGPANNAVTEDVVVVDGKLTASGSLLVTDIDQNQSSFQTTVAPVGSTLGSLVLGADGLYSFTVLNANAQYLGAADSKVDTFTVKSFDGTAKDISFTTFGTNDAALIGDPTVADVTESFQVVSGNLRASGTISVSDVDQNQSGFQTGVTSASGALGNLVLAVDGSYVYRVANSAVLYLGDAETKVDTFTIKSIDGTAKDVSFTIHGVNQGATIGDPSPAAVVEDFNPILGRLTETGKITITDPDTGEAKFQTAVTAAAGDKGQLVLAEDGTYTYSVLNQDVQYLGAGIIKTDTFTIKSFDGTSKAVNFTITGVNDDAIISDPAAASVTEDVGVLANRISASGQLTVTDVDAGESSFRTAVIAAAGDKGQLTLATDGRYVYSVLNADVQYLGAGVTKTDTFTVKSFDGTAKDISFTITGVNDAAVIGGPVPGAVTEDLNPNGLGRLTETGRLTVSDADTGESSFQTGVTAGAGDLGQLTLATDGSYSYGVANADVQYLGAGITKTDTFTVKSFDGTEKEIAFTITGVNDAAVIGGPSPAAVTEDLSVNGAGRLVESGRLTVSDVDTGEASFRTAVTAAAGDKGQLTLATDGSYTYSVLNTDVQYLGVGITKIDTFTVKSLDGTAKDISFTITGVNDAAVISGPVPGAVIEDFNPNGLGRLTENGRLTVSDVDTGESSFQIGVTPGAGDLGSLTLATDGSYSYSVANTAVQYLGAGITKTDTFTVKSFDGTEKEIAFTITGVNDAAVIGGPSPAAVTEDFGVNGAGRLVESGRLTVSDVDTGQASFSTIVTAAAGDKGQLTLATDGSYTYSVLNTEVQYLGAGETKTDTFTVKSLDGTAKDISFTITGVNDVAVIGDLSNNRVTEDLAPVGPNLQAAGTISVSDADQNQGFFSTTVAPTSGNIGTLVLDRNGNYVYRAPNQDTQYLRATDSKVDTFRISALDGTSKDVSFRIQGVNDAAIIGAPTASVVRENEDVSPDGFLSAAGTISISDADQFESAFLTTVVPSAGTDGTLTLAADGSYTYKVENSLHLYLPLNQVKTETFTISSVDGTTKNIDFTIRGVNNPAQIGAPSPAAVTEDVAVGLDGKLTETGRITISDLDNGEAAFRTVVEAGAGDKGQLTLAADGAYSYSVANSAVQYLGAGQTQVDTFVIKTIDGTAKTLSFTITGVNDVATISTPTPARVTEDIGAADGYLRTGGILTVTDADAGQSSFQTAVTALGSHIGALALASDGTYQYSVANAQVQYLGDGETKVESFTIKSLDGTSKDVSFTIIGANDGAIIGDPTDSIVIEDTELFRGNLVASGTISITDPDAGQSSFKTTVVPLVNTWGSLTLAADGAYTYSVANNLVALQAINEGQTKVDQFTITSFDGTKKVVDFTIKGIYDGPPANVAPVVGPLIQQAFFVGDAQKNIAVGGPDTSLANDPQDGVNLSRGSATYWVDGKPVSQLPSWIKFAGPEQVINVDPSYVNADLFNLATGATKVVDINYVISDSNGGKVAQSAMITVTGKDIYTPVFSNTSGLTDIYRAGSSTKSIDLLEGIALSPGGATMSIKNVVIAVDGVTVQSLPGVSGSIGASTTAFSIDTSDIAYTSMATGTSKTAVISYDVVNTVTGNADLFKSIVQTEIITIVKDAAVAPSIITGTSRSDVLRAADSGQTLIGVGGNDVLIGGKGNDVLISGGGNDVLTGGLGADTFKYTVLADSPKSAATATDTITDFSKSQGDKVDLSGILTSSSTVTSTINIDQTLSPSNSKMTLTVGSDTYHIATLAGQELSTPDILASSASGTNLTTALNGASWTTVVDVSGSNGAPVSVTASGATASVSGATPNPTGNWTEVVTAGAAVVDTTAQQTTFTTPSASNSVAITTADVVTHEVANVTVVQWHL
ncbi:Type I secretion C-terminal target domain, VC_A0849 subclass [Burkholderiaceae bacterium]